MCLCCYSNTEEKSNEKEEKTQGMASANVNKKEKSVVSYLANQVRIYNREQYFKLIVSSYLRMSYLSESLLLNLSRFLCFKFPSFLRNRQIARFPKFYPKMRNLLLNLNYRSFSIAVYFSPYG